MNKWQYILFDLKSIGITQEQIQQETGISQPFLSQLKTGKRKKLQYETGLKLTEFHKKHQNQIQKLKTPSDN